jgi:hypothetical protein
MADVKWQRAAILFSADPRTVTVDDAARHLADHEELYWEVGFQILRDKFVYPLYGFIHIMGRQVEYRATIRKIVRFSSAEYEDETFGAEVKPGLWIREWKENINQVRARSWKNSLVMTEIVPFSYDTYSFKKYDGTKIKRPPETYIRVLLPEDRA